MVTEYGCGHNLVHSTVRCPLKPENSPYQHFPLCEHKEVVRRCGGNCCRCNTKFQEHIRYARKNTTSSWIRKIVSTRRIFAPLERIRPYWNLGEKLRPQRPVAVSGPVVATKRPAIGTRRAVNSATADKHSNTKVATAIRGKALPYPVDAGDKVCNLRNSWSWEANDDLPWQQASLPGGEAISSPPAQSRPRLGPPVSPLDTLPSQQQKLFPKVPESIKRREHPRRKRSSNPPIKSEFGEPHLGGQHGWKINTPKAAVEKPTQERLATPVKSSRAEQAENNAQQNEKKLSHRKPLPVSAASLWTDAEKPEGISPLTKIPIIVLTAPIESQPSPAKRRSRSDEQVAELFLGGNFTTADETKNETRIRSAPPILPAGLFWQPARHAQEQNRAGTASNNTKPGFAGFYQGPPVMSGAFPDAMNYPKVGNNNPMKDKAKVQSMPTVHRIGRRDDTYKADSVGQIPIQYDTTRKFENRKARLTKKEEDAWSQYLGCAGLTEPGRTENTRAKDEKWAGFGPCFHQSHAQDGGIERPTPGVHELASGPNPLRPPAQGPASMRIKEEMRMSSRISRPGLYDYYAQPVKLELPTARTPTKRMEMGTAPTKGEVSVYSKQPRGQVPTVRLPDLRHIPSFRPQAECTWDRLVVKAVASIESI
jgi:hypothetical protein